ncbi:RNA polymerase sigma factor [Pedobacter frigiditerrae]|uniref:RNA polymerase sigma factor n=1 Tax=Pedobacter frigiditerrae TaxID=2530452 RepID=UPI0029302933|nr:sigma-70 family RNA polymerase sigma factor [Pedobacter frigiditerrae]
MTTTPLHNEKTLLAAIAKGDERAFRILFETHCDNLGSYVLKITKSQEISEEIVQDTFVKIWLGREHLAEIRSFSHYLFILCKNQTLDHLRKHAKQLILDAELDSYLKDQQIVEASENNLEVYRELIDKAVDKLPNQAKKVYLLSRHQRLKHDEIAVALGISAETVKKHIQYAVSFIKKDVNSKIDLTIVMILTSSIIFS